MVLPLQAGIMYGPVNSRRYGRSLGINLMPTTYKLCSFNCVYCHYGRTTRCLRDASEVADDLPDPDAVSKALEAALRSSGSLDLITFSGNGEPTIHPAFPELVQTAVRLRDRIMPAVRVALLSNASGLVRPDVRQVIGRIDLPVFKLDAGTSKTFRAINRPAAGISLESLVAYLSEINGVYVQTVLVDGAPTNTSDDELSAYIRLLQRIQPEQVHMYSIDRPAADQRVSLVNADRLASIARFVSLESGVEVLPFGGK